MLRVLLLAALCALGAAQETVGDGTITIDRIVPNAPQRIFWLNAGTTRLIQYSITSGNFQNVEKTLELMADNNKVIASAKVGLSASGKLEFKASSPAGFVYTGLPTAYFRITDNYGGNKRHLFSSGTFALASASIAVTKPISTNAAGQLLLTVDVTLSHPSAHSVNDRITVYSNNGGDQTCYLSTGTATQGTTTPTPKDKFACTFAYDKATGGRSFVPIIIGLYVFAADDTKAVASIFPDATQTAAWTKAGI